MVLSWFSHGSLMVLAWFSHGSLMVFSCSEPPTWFYHGLWKSVSHAWFPTHVSFYPRGVCLLETKPWEKPGEKLETWWERKKPCDRKKPWEKPCVREKLCEMIYIYKYIYIYNLYIDRESLKREPGERTWWEKNTLRETLWEKKLVRWYITYIRQRFLDKGTWWENLVREKPGERTWWENLVWKNTTCSNRRRGRFFFGLLGLCSYSFTPGCCPLHVLQK